MRFFEFKVDSNIGWRTVFYTLLTYAAGHVAVFASPMYVTVTPLLHSHETPDYILVTRLLHKCYAFCGIHNVAFCVVFTMWHFVRSSHCGILSGIRYLHVILKQNFSFCGYNHTRKFVQYMMKFRIN